MRASLEKDVADHSLSRPSTMREAYFNIGQYYLARQDRIKAREFSEKTVATGMLMYAEYGDAVLELQRLSQTPS